MISRKKEGVASGSGKAQCSSIGEYQKREVGRVLRGTGEGNRAYGTFWEGGSRKGEIN